MRRLPGMILSLFIAAIAAEQRPQSLVQDGIEALLASRNCPAGTIGVMVTNVVLKTPVAAVCADSMYNPASLTKLFTAAAAFEKLGSQHTFTTRIFADTVAEEGSGFSIANLYIQGDGDPGFTAERLWLFVEHLYHRGLRKVTGDIVIDDFLFDSLIVGPGFDEDSGSRAYQPYINALAMNYNCVAVHSRPGLSAKDPVVIDLLPEIAGMKIQSSAATAGRGKKSALDCATVPDSGAPGTLVIVQGSKRVDEPGAYTFRKLWKTWESFGGALRPLLARRGILFNGRIVHARLPKNLAARKAFYEFESEPLSRPVNDMFKYSSNFAAEMLFKTLSARRDSSQGSWGRSSAILEGWWKECCLPEAPVIKNGSGMGDCNRVSAAQVVALLCHVWEQKNYCPEYVAALSTAGVDGTLKSRFGKSKLKGLVRGKTGTLNSYGVSALAGYLQAPDRGTYAFAILCSKTGHTQYEDWVTQEKILEKVVEGLVKKEK